jgi:hypothetical protein
MRTLHKALIGGALLAAMVAPASWADGGNDGGKIRWQAMVGIMEPGNLVGGTMVPPAIPGGGQPWSVLGGQAYVDLLNNVTAFSVKGLVLAGGDSIGTPGPINKVIGTLVCSPGTASQTIVDTRPVPLDPQGNASFYGRFTSSTAACINSPVAFLVRIFSSNSAINGRWIANGAVRTP